MNKYVTYHHFAWIVCILVSTLKQHVASTPFNHSALVAPTAPVEGPAEASPPCTMLKEVGEVTVAAVAATAPTTSSGSFLFSSSHNAEFHPRTKQQQSAVSTTKSADRSSPGFVSFLATIHNVAGKPVAVRGNALDTKELMALVYSNLVRSSQEHLKS